MSEQVKSAGDAEATTTGETIDVAKAYETPTTTQSTTTGATTTTTTTTLAEHTVELDRQNEARMEEIERTTRQQPLTSDRFPISELDRQYQQSEAYSVNGNNNFLAGVAVLKKHYGHIRMVRGDGNCYYRAFLYSLVETILLQQQQQSSSSSDDDKNNKSTAKKEGERIVSWLKKESWDTVLSNGYDEMTIEMFHDAIVELMERVTGTGATTGGDGTARMTKLEEFHTEMNQENGTSDYCTWYMRVITAAHLKSDPNRFLPFIEPPGLDIYQFCQREVEPMVSFKKRSLRQNKFPHSCRKSCLKSPYFLPF